MSLKRIKISFSGFFNFSSPILPIFHYLFKLFYCSFVANLCYFLFLIWILLLNPCYFNSFPYFPFILFPIISLFNLLLNFFRWVSFTLFEMIDLYVKLLAEESLRSTAEYWKACQSTCPTLLDYELLEGNKSEINSILCSILYHQIKSITRIFVCVQVSKCVCVCGLAIFRMNKKLRILFGTWFIGKAITLK